MNRFDNFLYLFIITLFIFIVGVQVGIVRGKELQRQDYYECILAN